MKRFKESQSAGASGVEGKTTRQESPARRFVGNVLSKIPRPKKARAAAGLENAIIIKPLTGNPVFTKKAIDELQKGKSQVADHQQSTDHKEIQDEIAIPPSVVEGKADERLNFDEIERYGGTLHHQTKDRPKYPGRRTPSQRCHELSPHTVQSANGLDISDKHGMNFSDIEISSRPLEHPTKDRPKYIGRQKPLLLYKEAKHTESSKKMYEVRADEPLVDYKLCLKPSEINPPRKRSSTDTSGRGSSCHGSIYGIDTTEDDHLAISKVFGNGDTDQMLDEEEKSSSVHRKFTVNTSDEALGCDMLSLRPSMIGMQYKRKSASTTNLSSSNQSSFTKQESLPELESEESCDEGDTVDAAPTRQQVTPQKGKGAVCIDDLEGKINITGSEKSQVKETDSTQVDKMERDLCLEEKSLTDEVKSSVDMVIKHGSDLSKQDSVTADELHGNITLTKIKPSYFAAKYRKCTNTLAACCSLSCRSNKVSLESVYESAVSREAQEKQQSLDKLSGKVKGEVVKGDRIESNGRQDSWDKVCGKVKGEEVIGDEIESDEKQYSRDMVSGDRVTVDEVNGRKSTEDTDGRSEIKSEMKNSDGKLGNSSANDETLSSNVPSEASIATMYLSADDIAIKLKMSSNGADTNTLLKSKIHFVF